LAVWIGRIGLNILPSLPINQWMEEAADVPAPCITGRICA